MPKIWPFIKKLKANKVGNQRNSRFAALSNMYLTVDDID